MSFVFGKVRFWDFASGKEVRVVAASEFSFKEEGSSRTHQHCLASTEDMLRIAELPPLGAEYDTAVPVACFKAPQP